MKNFESLIRQRRSIRKFTDELLKPEEVEKILKAALMAPSSKCKTPWEFVVVEDKETLKKLAGCKEHGAKFLEGCALAVVVLCNGMLTDAWIEDGAIAAIYMQLEAEDLGLGSCWCHIRNRQTADDTDSDNYIREMFGIPYQMDVLCVIGFGHKEQERMPFDAEKLQWEKVHIGQYPSLHEED